MHNVTKIDNSQIENLSVTAINDIKINNIQNNETLLWNSASACFVNSPISAVSVSGNQSLDTLSNVELSNKQNDDMLIYDSNLQKWINIQKVLITDGGNF